MQRINITQTILLLTKIQHYLRPKEAIPNKIIHKRNKHVRLLKTPFYHQDPLLWYQTPQILTAYIPLLCSTVCLSGSTLQLCPPFLPPQEISPLFGVFLSFSNIVPHISLSAPQPQKQHIFSGQLNRGVLLHFNYLSCKANSPVKHMKSTNLVLWDYHLPAPHYIINK